MSIGKMFKLLVGGVLATLLVIIALRVLSNTRQATELPDQNQNIMDKIDVQLDAQGNSGQSATAIFEDVEGKTKITVTSANMLSDSQPVTIRAGICDNLGSISYKLNDLVSGRSETTIAPALHFLHGLGELSLTIHKSNQETGVTTACTNLKPAFDAVMQ